MAPRRRSRFRWLLVVGLAVAFVWGLRRRPRPSHVGDAEEATAPQAAPAVAPHPEELADVEAARILGCSVDEVPGLLDGRPVTREAIEQLAVEHYRWRKHVDDPDSYWVTLKQASAILGVPSQQVKQLLETGRLPYVVHRDGVRLMRREELAP